MKQSVNIFIVIGVIFLASGQLQGMVKRREMGEINTRPRIAKKRKEIEDMIAKITQDIKDELTKSPGSYKAVNFSKIYNKIQGIKKATMNEQLKLEQEDDIYKFVYNFEYIQAEIDSLYKQLADALLENLTKLSGPIIEQVEKIIKHVEKTKNIRTHFIPGYIKGLITNEISPRLDSAFQKDLLSEKEILTQAEQSIIDTALQAEQKIIVIVEQLFTLFIEHIEELNKINKKNKEEKQATNFTKSNFDKTVQAIQTMQWIINNLYNKLRNTFSQIDSLSHISLFTTSATKLKKISSQLKSNLYRIYEVKQSLFGKISIKIYRKKWPFRGLYYDYPQDDPLKDISPRVAEIKPQQSVPPVEKSFIRKLGTRAVVMLAATMADQIVQAVREGMPLKQAVLVAIESLATLGMVWTAKEGLTAIKEAKEIAAEKEKLRQTMEEETERLKEEEAIKQRDERLKQPDEREKQMKKRLKQAAEIEKKRKQATEEKLARIKEKKENARRQEEAERLKQEETIKQAKEKRLKQEETERLKQEETERLKQEKTIKQAKEKRLRQAAKKLEQEEAE